MRRSSCGRDHLTPGYTTASVDNVDILVRESVVTALPYTTKDPIVIASRIVLTLRTLVSREKNPLDPAVVARQLPGGSKHNIIRTRRSLNYCPHA
jgi:hippurate hydrolase